MRKTVHEDDALINNILPKLMLHLSKMPKSLGLTAKQVIRGVQQPWKHRVFGGGGSDLLSEARRNYENETWWSEQSVRNLESLQRVLEVKINQCESVLYVGGGGGGFVQEEDGGDDDDGDGVSFKTRGFPITAKTPSKSKTPTKTHNAPRKSKSKSRRSKSKKMLEKEREECNNYKLLFNRTQRYLVKKSKNNTNNDHVKDALEQEDDQDFKLLQRNVEPMAEKKDELDKITAELDAVRQVLEKSKFRIKEVENEIANYESDSNSSSTEDEDWQTMLTEAKEEKRKLTQEISQLVHTENSLVSKKEKLGHDDGSLAKQVFSKFKEKTGLDPQAQKEAFQQNLEDALDERLGGHGFIMTMYLKLIIYLRRKLRRAAEDILPKQIKEEHAKNVFFKEGRSWEEYVKTDVWKALYSTTVIASHKGLLAIYETLFIIFKNPLLIKSFLFIGRVMKNKLCVRIKLFVHSAKLDATPTTFSEMAAQTGDVGRKFLPADKIANLLVDFLPMGKNTISGILKGTQATFNCLALDKVPILGPALNVVFMFTLLAAEDTLQTLTEINFLSTTVEDFYKSLNYFDCLADPLTMKINQSWWGFKDEFKIFDMKTYYVDQKNRVVQGNAFQQYKTVGSTTTTFVASGGKRLYHYDKIAAEQENIDILYILLADNVLQVSQIQPPGLKYPIGHWTESAKRKRQDELHGRLLSPEFYKSSPDENASNVGSTLKSYNSEQTSEYQKFIGFKSNLHNEAMKERYHRELSKKYIKNYRKGTNVFVMNGSLLRFTDSNYGFLNEENKNLFRTRHGGGGAPTPPPLSTGGKTFSLLRDVSKKNNNKTMKITL
jgi:hypothetical protein